MQTQGLVKSLSGWGRYPRQDCLVIAPSSPEQVTTLLQAGTCNVIARGNGRSYGDANFNSGLTIDTRNLNRLLAFDELTGSITCEAGVFLSDLVKLFIPRGWFPPVTPGTKFVTVGGMVASDVHGKNHHISGSFCDHVQSLRLTLGEGRILTCSRLQNADLFAATCGGMGLTGIVLDVTFRMVPIYSSRIVQEKRLAPNLATAIELFEGAPQPTFSVAWIDSLATGANLGRSVVLFGEHALVDPRAPEQASGSVSRRVRRLPLDLPSFALNRMSVSLFNGLYYWLQRSGSSLVDLDSYFYPLDAIEDWNRIYGRRGFVQYQCVLPLETSRDGLRELLTKISRAGQPSFLTVLKRLGSASFGHLSFPMEGYTLALDFPAKPDTFRLLDHLDEIVVACEGRIYLAKDARMKPQVMEAGYSRLDTFRQVRRRYGIDGIFRSALSDRLEI